MHGIIVEDHFGFTQYTVDGAVQLFATGGATCPALERRADAVAVAVEMHNEAAITFVVDHNIYVWEDRHSTQTPITK